jgi:anti-sigma regulatory factor (Ser/Thr protein kinase)
MCTKATAAATMLAPRQVRLEPTVRAPGDARSFVSAVLNELGHSDLVENATLIVSELVTNSLAAAPNGLIQVDIWRTGAFLDLEVRDCSAKPPECLHPDVLAEGGRGLQIVQHLATSFGYTTFHCGKVVWAILGLTGGEYHDERCRNARAGAARDDPGISWV